MLALLRPVENGNTANVATVYTKKKKTLFSASRQERRGWGKKKKQDKDGTLKENNNKRMQEHSSSCRRRGKKGKWADRERMDRNRQRPGAVEIAWSTLAVVERETKGSGEGVMDESS